MSRLLILKVHPDTHVIYCYCRIALKMKRVTVETIEGEPVSEGFFLSFNGEGDLDEATGIIRAQNAHVKKPDPSDFIYFNHAHQTPIIRAWIGFSGNQDHITNDRRMAWADWYGFLDVSRFRDRFGNFLVHNVEIVVKPDLMDKRESWKQPFTMKYIRKSFKSLTGELHDFLKRLEQVEEQERRKRESEQVIVPIEEIFQNALDFDSKYKSAASDLPQEPLATLSLTERSRRLSLATARLGQSSETEGSLPLLSPCTSLPPPGISAHMWAPHQRPVENSFPQSAYSETHDSRHHFGSVQAPHRQDDCHNSVRSQSSSHEPPQSSRSTQQPRPQDYQYRCDPSRYEVNPSRGQSRAQGYFHNDNSHQYDKGRQNEYQRNPSKRYDDEETSYARADQQSSGRAGNGNHHWDGQHQESRMSPYHIERFSGSAQQNRQDNRQKFPEPSRHDMDREPFYTSSRGYQQSSYQPDNRQGSQPHRDRNQYRSESPDQHRFQNGTPQEKIYSKSTAYPESSREFVSCYRYDVEAVPLIHEGNRIVVWLPDYKQAAAIWRTNRDFCRIRLGEGFLCKMNYIQEDYGINWHISQISDSPSNLRYSLNLFERKANGYEALAMRHNVDLFAELDDFRAWHRDNWDPMLSTRDGVVVVMGSPVRNNEGEFRNPWKALNYYKGRAENRWFFSKCHLDYRQIPREVVDRQYRGREIVRRYVWVLHEIEGLEQVITYKEERARERNHGRYQ